MPFPVMPDAKCLHFFQMAASKIITYWSFSHRLRLPVCLCSEILRMDHPGGLQFIFPPIPKGMVSKQEVFKS